MLHSQSRQSAWRLTVSDAHCVYVPHTAWTISRSLGLRECVGESTPCRRRGSEWPRTDLCYCCCCIASHCNLTHDVACSRPTTFAYNNMYHVRAIAHVAVVVVVNSLTLTHCQGLDLGSTFIADFRYRLIRGTPYMRVYTVIMIA